MGRMVPLNKAGRVTDTSAGTLDPGKLDRLLHAYGIASEFIEFSGNVANIPLEHRMNILRAMNVSVESDAQLDELLADRASAAYVCWLPPVVVLHEGESTCALMIDVREREEMAAEAGKIYWRVRLEDGSECVGECEPATLPLVSTHDCGTRMYERRLLTLPVLAPGYHHAEFSSRDCSQGCLLIVAPTRTWQPDCLERSKLWGLSVQLYSLRSDDNWGMGDFADLGKLIAHAAHQHAAFVLLNPLHALDLRYPENASPYSPSDRRYVNPLYIAPALCPEFTEASVQQRINSAEVQAQLEALRAAGQVDYAGVQALKLDILGCMYHAFRERQDEERSRDFRDFVDRGGSALEEFAASQASLFTGTGSLLNETDFHLWLQWKAQRQLDACQQAALQAGMPIGLVRDLAVGSSIDGTEVKGNPGLFCEHARIGAPPDNFNPDGQNWGLPPLMPTRLQETRFAHFIALLRTNMRACGALRIDHVMSLMRLWWCPDDGSNASGAYVHYPVDALFAILRLESVRNQCAVIGEDLGVVPPEIRRYLEDGRLYSNAVFYFEKYDNWHFRKPEHYKEMALAMIANHDVPPLAAWWNCGDLELRRKIGLINSDDKLQQEHDHRNGEKGQLLQWLSEQGLLPGEWQDRNVHRELDQSLRVALVSACGRAASRLVSLQVDDLARVDTPVNIPGTSAEYPNWRRKVPLPIDAIFADADAQAMMQALAGARGA
jgi:4-alpha-glucanotransferase